MSWSKHKETKRVFSVSVSSGWPAVRQQCSWQPEAPVSPPTWWDAVSMATGMTGGVFPSCVCLCVVFDGRIWSLQSVNSCECVSLFTAVKVQNVNEWLIYHTHTEAAGQTVSAAATFHHMGYFLPSLSRPFLLLSHLHLSFPTQHSFLSFLPSLFAIHPPSFLYHVSLHLPASLLPSVVFLFFSIASFFTSCFFLSGEVMSHHYLSFLIFSLYPLYNSCSSFLNSLAYLFPSLFVFFFFSFIQIIFYFYPSFSPLDSFKSSFSFLHSWHIFPTFLPPFLPYTLYLSFPCLLPSFPFFIFLILFASTFPSRFCPCFP